MYKLYKLCQQQLFYKNAKTIVLKSTIKPLKRSYFPTICTIINIYFCELSGSLPLT